MTERPARAQLLPVARPEIDEQDLASVRDALLSGWGSIGPKVAEFERAVAARLGVPEVLATASGTAALHLSMLGVGVGPGDEVLVPSLTFTSTASVVLLAGATPVFVDVDPRTLCLDPEDARRKVTARTRALVVVHFAGRAAALEAVGALCRERGLALVEDAAHAFGASWRGEPIGRHGDYVCFSFHATKTLTTGEGGALVVRDPAKAREARLRSWHGVDLAGRGDRPPGTWWPYDVELAGFKYNMNDPQAALGLSQLAKVDRMGARRAQIARHYLEALAPLQDRIELPDDPREAGHVHAWHLFALRLRAEARTTRERFMAGLRGRNIATSVHYPPVHRHSAFAPYAVSLPVTEALGESLVSLPLFSAMTDDDARDVCDAVRRVLG